MKEYLVKY